MASFAYLSSILDGFALSSLMAISVYLVLNGGVHSFAYVGFMAVGGYTSVVLTVHYQAPFLVSLGAGVLLALLLSALVAAPILRLKGIYQAVGTMAFTAIIQVLAMNFDSVTGGVQGIRAIPVKTNVWWLMGLLGFVVYLLHSMRHSRTGRALSAVRQDEVAAGAMGVPVRQYKLLAFALSAAIAALAGGLSAHLYNFISPDEFGFHAITSALLVAVLGGTGHWVGPILGALIMSLLPEVLRAFGLYRDVVLGLMLVLIIVYKPTGIYGYIEAVQHRRKRAARSLVPLEVDSGAS